METKELYLKTAFCCMACDGSIVEEETNLLKEKVQKSELFSGIDIENTLNGYVNNINLVGSSFLVSFLEELTVENQLGPYISPVETSVELYEIKYSNTDYRLAVKFQGSQVYHIYENTLYDQ